MEKARSEDRSLFGGNVRSLRKSLGWTLDVFAERSGVGLTTLKRIEAGAGCSVRTQERLAAALATAVSSLWEPNLFGEGRAALFRPEDTRWRFATAEEAAAWALNEDPRRIDPDAIQAPDERARLGRNGLAVGFARVFRRQFPSGYLGCLVYESFARKHVAFAPHVNAACFYGVRGALTIWVDDEPHPLRDGDALLLDPAGRVEIAPERPVLPGEPPPLLLAVLAQLGAGKPAPRPREAPSESERPSSAAT